MDIPPLIKIATKQQIVNAFVATRKGEMTEEEYDLKFEKALQYVYDAGREMGMTEALNYVENSADRERLFGGIDELREAIDNEC